MILVTIKRSIWFAIQSFWRNIWLSLATIFIISLTFMSINFLVAINAISDSAILAIKDRVDVSIYFKPEVRDSILVKNPEDRQYFTRRQCELINGIARREGDQDSLEEVLELSTEEQIFWEKTMGN